MFVHVHRERRSDQGVSWGDQRLGSDDEHDHEDYRTLLCIFAILGVHREEYHGRNHGVLGVVRVGDDRLVPLAILASQTARLTNILTLRWLLVTLLCRTYYQTIEMQSSQANLSPDSALWSPASIATQIGRVEVLPSPMSIGCSGLSTAVTPRRTYR